MADKHVMGLFDSYDHANKAFLELLDEGFDKDEVTFAAREDVFSKIMDTSDGDDLKEGVAAGATVGGLVGLAAGVGAITIPGVGPLITAGSLASILGSTVAGAAGGGLVGALVDMGMDRSTAETYIEGIEKGGVVIAVTVDDDNEGDVKDIFNKHGAREVRVHSI